MKKLAVWHKADHIEDVLIMQSYINEQSSNMYNELLYKVFKMVLGNIELNEKSATDFRIDITPIKHEIYFKDKLIGHIPMSNNVGYDGTDFEENKFTMALTFIPVI